MSIIQESVVYQDIFQKGEQRGEQRGVQRGMWLGELRLALLMLEQRFGALTPALRRRLESLEITQVEELGKSLLSFNDKQDLRNWLRRQKPQGSQL